MEASDQLVGQVNAHNGELVRKNERLINESQSLRNQIIELKSSAAVNSMISKDMSKLVTGTVVEKDEFYADLEFKFAETRSELARMKEINDDLLAQLDNGANLLNEEKLRRIHSEKERDAYSSAYEASMVHFEKWVNDSRKNNLFGAFDSMKRTLLGQKLSET